MGGALVHPVCASCAHFREEESDEGEDGDLDTPLKQACDAYPDGIPQDDAFVAALFATSHLTPLPGDHGVLWKEAPPPGDDDDEE